MIHVINGPNLNLLGTREPEIYGSATLADVKTLCERVAGELGETVDFSQCNGEGQLVDLIQRAKRQNSRGIALNPGAYAHTSVALFDAVKAVNIPTVEVHISNVFAREEFRSHSYVSRACRAVISGLGISGYDAAIRNLCEAW